MLWKCIECGNVVQTQDDKPPSPIKRYKNDDHVCKDWEEDKSVPQPFAGDEFEAIVGEAVPLSEKESRKLEAQLKRQRLQKLKRGTHYRDIQRD